MSHKQSESESDFGFGLTVGSLAKITPLLPWRLPVYTQTERERERERKDYTFITQKISCLFFFLGGGQGKAGEASRP